MSYLFALFWMLLRILKTKDISKLVLAYDDEQNFVTFDIRLREKTKTNTVFTKLVDKVQSLYLWLLYGIDRMRVEISPTKATRIQNSAQDGLNAVRNKATNTRATLATINWNPLTWRPHKWIVAPMDMGTAIDRFNFLSSLGMGVFYALVFVYLTKTQGWSVSEIGVLMAVSAIMGIVAGPFWALIADSAKQHKLVLRIVMGATIGCMVWLAFSPPKPIVWALLVLVLFLGAALTPITDGLIGSYSHDEAEFAKKLAIGVLGTGAGVLVTGYMSRLTGLTIIFWLYAAVLLLCMLVLRNFPNASKPSKEESAKQKRTMAEAKASLVKLKPLFSRKLLGFWLTVFLVGGPLQAFSSISGVLYTATGRDAADVGTATMFGFVIQWLTMRYLMQKRYQLLSDTIRKRISYVAVAFIGTSWLAIYFLQSPLSFWLAYAGYGIGLALLFTNFSWQMTEIAGKELAASGISVLYAFISIAFFSSSAISTVATKLSSDDLITALLFGIITFVGLVTMITMMRTMETTETEITPQLSTSKELVLYKPS